MVKHFVKTTHEIMKTIEQLQKDVDDANAALAEAKKQKAETDKTAFLKKLEATGNAFKALDTDTQAAILASPDWEATMAPFQVSTRKKSKGGRFNEEKILLFLADGPKEQGLVQTHCKTTKQSVGNWGKKLVDAGKITVEAKGQKKIWTKIWP